jgi:hypothetical protein
MAVSNATPCSEDPRAASACFHSSFGEAVELMTKHSIESGTFLAVVSSDVLLTFHRLSRWCGVKYQAIERYQHANPSPCVVALDVSLLLGYLSLTPEHREWVDDPNQKDEYAIVIATTHESGEGRGEVRYGFLRTAKMRLTIDRPSGKQTYLNALGQGLDQTDRLRII